MAIERKTQNSDVMERVLGLDAPGQGEDVHTEVITLAVHPSLAGAAVTAVQLTVGGVTPLHQKAKRER